MLTVFIRFRWVVCQLDILKKHLKQDILRKALKSLPGDLNETYDQILKSIDEDYIEDAFKILQWLVHSTRPLDLAEVAEVVAVDLGEEPQFDPTNRLGEPLDVLRICSSLVTTVTRTRSEYDGHEYLKGEIRLAHFSVKEYLISARARIRKQGTEYSIPQNDQGCLAQTCLAYLLYLREPAMLTPSHAEDFPLAEYAANYWFAHAKATTNDVEKIHKLGLKLCRSSGAYVNWIRLRDLDGYELGDHELSNRDIDRFHSSSRFPPPLYYAALAGLVDFARFLLENGADVNAEGGNYAYALQAASVIGHQLVVRLLLEYGADINARGGQHTTALHAACYKGHENIVRLLHEQGADINAEDVNRRTALQLAQKENQAGIIKALFEIWPNLRHNDLAHELREAAFKGQLTVVEKLLEDGADINAQGGQHNSALQAASYCGHEAVVKLLLEKGANVNLRDEIRQCVCGSALQAASYCGHEAVVKLLLEMGADVNLRDKKSHFGFDSALQAASVRGRVAIVQILLDNGADINARGGECGSALQAAACERHEKVVELLLENGADINICTPGGLYLTALSAAAFGEREAIVRLLLKNGIDRTYCDEAILSVADAALVADDNKQESAWCRIVQLMHENGAKFSPNAFMKFCRVGQLAVVKLMLDMGLDFAPDTEYYSKALKNVDEGEEYAIMLAGHRREVSNKGHSAIRDLLRVKISCLCE